jgi:hypothetical protein
VKLLRQSWFYFVVALLVPAFALPGRAAMQSFQKLKE